MPAVRDYVPLGKLEVGTALHVQGGGEALLVSKTWRQGDFEVFDFEVEGLHNFYVRGEGSDAAGVLVHNSTASTGVLTGAKFAQKTHGEVFSDGGKFAGQTVDEVAGALKSGTLSVDDVPIDYIVRDGNTLMLNTRSATALERAGIARSQWNAVDQTGSELHEALLDGQLSRNKLTSEGIETVRSSAGDD